MLPFARLARHRLLLTVAAVGWATALGTADALAAASVPALQITPRATAPAAASTTDTVLKRLPADAGQLTFEGESAVRSFTIQLGRTEAARTGAFQIALLNAVSLLPERSVIKVAINGTVLAAVPAASTDKPTLTSIRIPPGLLVPGPNTVRITAALSHRVDCSVKATYELWAKLIPAQTGFMVPRDAAGQIRSIDDLALEPLAEDGTTRIHLRMGDDAEASTLSQAAGLIDAVARRAGITRPVVDVGPERGTGAGFDIVLGANPADGDGLAILGRNAGATIGRDKTTGRLIVMLDGTDAAAIAGATPAGTARTSRAPLQQGFRKSLAELGMPTEIFAGRHYMASLDVALPPDFLASNDRATLLLDGSHGGSLVEGSGLVFRVNGTLVSSMPLVAGRAERFQHAIVELPLRFFHPGHNELSIEGMTSSVADGQCDTINMPRDPRLTIAGTSELDFPNFAHLGTLPQIPAALASNAGGRDGMAHLYLPSSDRTLLGAGLTMLANLAVTQERVGIPQLHFNAPGELDPPGIVVAAGADLPEPFGTVLGRITVAADAPAEASPARAAAGSAETPVADADGAVVRTPAAAAPDPLDTARTMGVSLVGRAQTLLRDRGFFFGGEERANLLPVAPGGLVVAAMAPHADATVIGGGTLPQVASDPAHWLLVTAADGATTGTALARMIASGHWAALAGQAVSFDPKAETVRVLQPRTVSYVLPDRLVLSDIRPILGGILSDNIVLSAAVLLVLMTLLGVSTHAVIRRMGVQ